MSRAFNDKVIVVTGATGNLGSSICLAFAKVGAKIVAVDLHLEALNRMKAVFKDQNHEIMVAACDITQQNACQNFVAKTLQAYGRIDALINNAGITHIERYTEMDKSQNITRKVMEVNFFGAVNCTEVCIEQIRQNKGFFVNISSVAGFAPLLGRTAYAASKHALHGFFESLHSELQHEGVHCLMVCPSFIQAPEKRQASAADNSIYQDKKTIGKDVSPQSIAEDIVRCCRKNKPLLVAGKTGKISYWLQRFAPSLYRKLMIRNLKASV